MQTITKAKQIGGSIAVIIPKDVVEGERIFVGDTLKINVEKVDNLDFFWGRFKDIKKSTDKIMNEIDPIKFGRIKHPFNEKKYLEGVILGILAGGVGASFFVNPLTAFLGSFEASAPTRLRISTASSLGILKSFFVRR